MLFSSRIVQTSTPELKAARLQRKLSEVNDAKQDVKKN